jgi:hypothetical protein
MRRRKLLVALAGLAVVVAAGPDLQADVAYKDGGA